MLFRSFRLAPPPAKAGGGWEGVPTVQADPGAPLPNPPLPSQGREQGSGAVKLFPAGPRRTLRAFDFSLTPAFAGKEARLQATGLASRNSRIDGTSTSCRSSSTSCPASGWDEPLVGKECVSLGRSRWSTYLYKKK